MVKVHFHVILLFINAPSIQQQVIFPFFSTNYSIVMTTATSTAAATNENINNPFVNTPAEGKIYFR